MIIHVDMDAFYASVEERENPELKGKPVIVGGSAEKRGVVAAANYAVREFGVHSAMPTKTALKLCPNAIVIKPRIGFYAEVSKLIREVFHNYSPVVEPLALDEAFIDVSGSIRLFGTASDIGKAIKLEILERVNLVASVGVAPNKFLAKLASDIDKPNGFRIVEPNEIQDFLDPLPIKRVWGIGKSTQAVFEKLRIRTIKQLRELPEQLLVDRFGKSGSQIWLLANGIDNRNVVPDREAKSISHETTFSTDVSEMEVLVSCLLDQTGQVSRRLRRAEFKAKTISIKVRYDDFQTVTRSATLAEPTDQTELLWQCAKELLHSRLPVRPLAVRLLGMGVSNFDDSGRSQQMMFDQLEQQRNRSVDSVADQIKDRFGDDAVRRGLFEKNPKTNER